MDRVQHITELDDEMPNAQPLLNNVIELLDESPDDQHVDESTTAVQQEREDHVAFALQMVTEETAEGETRAELSSSEGSEQTSVEKTSHESSLPLLRLETEEPPSKRRCLPETNEMAIDVYQRTPSLDDDGELSTTRSNASSSSTTVAITVYEERRETDETHLNHEPTEGGFEVQYDHVHLIPKSKAMLPYFKDLLNEGSLCMKQWYPRACGYANQSLISGTPEEALHASVQNWRSLDTEIKKALNAVERYTFAQRARDDCIHQSLLACAKLRLWDSIRVAHIWATIERSDFDVQPHEQPAFTNPIKTWSNSWHSIDSPFDKKFVFFEIDVNPSQAWQTTLQEKRRSAFEIYRKSMAILGYEPSVSERLMESLIGMVVAYVSRSEAESGEWEEFMMNELEFAYTCSQVDRFEVVRSVFPLQELELEAETCPFVMQPSKDQILRKLNHYTAAKKEWDERAHSWALVMDSKHNVEEGAKFRQDCSLDKTASPSEITASLYTQYLPEKLVKTWGSKEGFCVHTIRKLAESHVRDETDPTDLQNRLEMLLEVLKP